MTAPGQAGRRGDGWISVEERLPDDDGNLVLVSGGVAYCNHNQGRWMTVTAADWPGRPIVWEVTHWQPLPAPPVADRQEGEDG